MAPTPGSRLGKCLRESGGDTPGPRAGAGRRFPSGYPLTARTAAPVPPGPINRPTVGLSRSPQGCVKLLDFSLSSIGWRRGLGRGGAFLLGSPLLGPLPSRSSRGEEGELDALLRSPRLMVTRLARARNRGQDSAREHRARRFKGSWKGEPRPGFVTDPVVAGAADFIGGCRHCDLDSVLR